MILQLSRNLSNLIINNIKNTTLNKNKLTTNHISLFKNYLTTESASNSNNETASETKIVDKNTETTSELPKSNKEQNRFSIAKAHPIGNLGWQPTQETHKALEINGVPYNKLNIVAIKASRNNTIMSLIDPNGTVLFSTSSGCVGFKNSKKSTAIAGQAAGIAMSENMKRRGIYDVRVTVKGFGNGRLPSIKSLQMSKINIVSITDNTHIPLPFARPARPPVKRRI